MDNIVDQYGWGNKPQGRWWNIKNHEEMRQYIQETIPHLVYNEQFLELLTDIEMRSLIQERMKRMAMNTQHSA